MGCFNPRAREGRDRIVNGKSPGNIRFNPRAREGRDLSWNHHYEVASLFQSTRPRGARRNLRAMIWWRFRVSIHAPARGATDKLFKSYH